MKMVFVSLSLLFSPHLAHPLTHIHLHTHRIHSPKHKCFGQLGDVLLLWSCALTIWKKNEYAFVHFQGKAMIDADP